MRDVFITTFLTQSWEVAVLQGRAGAYLRLTAAQKGAPYLAFERLAMELAAQHPTGTVTVLFTDIEGSTARWERDRVAMQGALQRHDRIVRAAIAERSGHVFKTIGDAFCSVFATPQDAVAAILAAQRTLMTEDFSAVDGLRVRAAIHTGPTDDREGDYFGPTVNKVARVLAIGHGGQVLVTAETALLVRNALPYGATLRDLGTYRLKDIPALQRLYQLIAPGLPAEFPPLRSLGTLPSDLSILDTQEFHPVPSFSGREQELAAVAAALNQEGAIAAIHGLGGIGKSSIAREYGWRNRERYSIVWWLNAQTEEGVIEGLLRLGAMFEQGLGQLADRRAAAQRVVNSLLGGFDRPVLLVFDNLEAEALMRKWLPRSGVRALATSRERAWSADVGTIPLESWSLEIAVRYLQRASGRNDLTEADAHAIVQALGALPLALSHAAAALRNLQMVGPRRYLERINAHLHNAPRGAEYPRSVFATFSTAIAQAEEQVPGAAAVLCFAASFAPDAIPDELFRQPSDAYGGELRPAFISGAQDLRSTIGDEFCLDEALGALNRLSLLTFLETSRTYRMHRLVQLAAKDLARGADAAWRACAVEVADSAFPEVEFPAWPQCARLWPHACAALEALPSPMPLGATRLANRCAVYLWRRGEYDSAATLHERVLAVREKTLEPHDVELAESVFGLANVYKDQGRHREAERLYKRALEIHEEHFGVNHVAVANSMVNLAALYEQMKQHYEEAENLCARALDIQEAALGMDDPNIATTLNNLANILFSQRRYEEAEPLLARAQAIWEKTLGPAHPDVAASMINRANVYYFQGRYADAERLWERGLEIQIRALGPQHPFVGLTLNNLGELFASQGRYEEAQSRLVGALEIRESTLIADHPHIASTLTALGDLRRKQGRYPEAEELYRRALSIRERAFGSDHPETEYVRQSLASFREQNVT